MKRFLLSSAINFLRLFFNSLLLRVHPFFWRMLVFHGRLNANLKREKVLEQQGVFAQKTFLLFGDSQIALWPLSIFFKSLPIRSRGIHGDCANSALNRFNKDAIALKADAILILVGTNDLARGRSPEEISSDIDGMIAKALKAGICPFVCSLLPVREVYLERRPLEEIKKTNYLLRKKTDYYQISYIDFWPVLTDTNGCLRAELTYDGLHPNRKCYSVMSKIIINKYHDFIGSSRSRI